MQYYKNTEDAPTFAEQYEATYGNKPNFFNYISACGIFKGIPMYLGDKFPDNKGLEVAAYILTPLIVIPLAIVLALPLLMFAVVWALGTNAK